MKTIQKFVSLTFLIFVGCFMFSNSAVANKTSVRIEADDVVVKGSEVTIKLFVSHKGNNFIHYTDWMYVKINGEEIKRWEFGNFSKPENENFTRTLTITIEEDTEITAEANCNMHGSAGIAKKIIRVSE